MPTGRLSFLARKLRDQGYDNQTIELVLDAWRPSTCKVYGNYLRKWALFCMEGRINIYKPRLAQACRFLRTLADRGLGHGAVNAARSALATILPMFGGYAFGKHPVVCALVKGVYERNPPQPKYVKFWDVQKVFKVLKEWGRNSSLNLKMLTLKLSVLLLLVTSQRGQTILALSVDTLEVEEVAVFRLKKLLKHNKLGDPLDTLILKPFDECYRLCPVRALKEYIKRTQSLRGRETQLLISFVRPHKAVSRDTLARWTLRVLELAGIDTARYKGHSTRGASASAANRLG